MTLADRLLLPLTLRPVLAAESGAASVSYGVAEWALVWVSVSDCLKRGCGGWRRSQC